MLFSASAKKLIFENWNWYLKFDFVMCCNGTWIIILPVQYFVFNYCYSAINCKCNGTDLVQVILKKVEDNGDIQDHGCLFHQQEDWYTDTNIIVACTDTFRYI